MFQGFSKFFLHHFVLAKSATSSIRVNINTISVAFGDDKKHVPLKCTYHSCWVMHKGMFVRQCTHVTFVFLMQSIKHSIYYSIHISSNTMCWTAQQSASHHVLRNG